MISIRRLEAAPAAKPQEQRRRSSATAISISRLFPALLVFAFLLGGCGDTHEQQTTAAAPLPASAAPEPMPAKVACGETLPEIGTYRPPEQTSLDFLPPEVRQNLQGSLEATFEPEIVRKLVFVSGCEWDSVKVAQNAPGRTTPKWRYSVIYCVPVDHDLLASYDFRVDLDSTGTPIGSLGIPRGPCGTKGTWASGKDIVALARAKMGHWNHLYAEFSRERHSIVFLFWQTLPYYHGRYDTERMLYIDACTGEVVWDRKIVPMD